MLKELGRQGQAEAKRQMCAIEGSGIRKRIDRN